MRLIQIENALIALIINIRHAWVSRKVKNFDDAPLHIRTLKASNSLKKEKK